MEHPIEGLMLTAMNSIKDMIDVNTIVGDQIQTSNNIVVIPISKVSFGFVSGGSEFKGETVDEYNKKDKDEQIQYRLPFGGGAGAGVSLNPIAFLVVQGDMVKLLPVNHSTSIDKLLDYIPDLFEKVDNMMNKYMQDKKEQKQNKENQNNGKENQGRQSNDENSDGSDDTSNDSHDNISKNKENEPETLYKEEYKIEEYIE